MIITMKETRAGADQGYDTREYLAGESYDVGEALAKSFCDEMKVATRGKAKGPAKAAGQQGEG